MTPKTTPYRLRYKFELNYPTKAAVLLPSHGSGPRCKVDYNPNDDGPWITVQIMRIDDDDVENYTCAMPRYYAIPLILINKLLAFYEAQCRPDGTPLPPSSSCGIKQRELREYSYLWVLRCRFLQAVFDMNHERVLNERWQYDGVHGFLHRMYRRFGHDTCHRVAYWREEIKEGRVPYSAPDIAEMDWKAYLLADMTTSTRINGFLWNRVSQGYTRVVKDEPPFEGWRAWRAGHNRDHKPVPYLTPASSPVREPPSELDGASAAAGPSSSSNCGAGGGGYDTIAGGVRIVLTAPPQTMQATAAAAATAAGSATAGRPRRGVRFGVAAAAGVARNGNGDEETEELEYAGHRDVRVLTADLVVQPNSQGWGLPSPSASSSSQQSQLSSSSSSAGRSTTTRTSSQGPLRDCKVSFTHNAPEDWELAVIQCIFTKRVEDVKMDSGPRLEATYVENLS